MYKKAAETSSIKSCLSGGGSVTRFIVDVFSFLDIYNNETLTNRKHYFAKVDLVWAYFDKIMFAIGPKTADVF